MILQFRKTSKDQNKIHTFSKSHTTLINLRVIQIFISTNKYDNIITE